MKVKATIFWLLMLGSAAVLWWTARRFSWSESLLIVVVVVLVVWLTSWFRGRFSGAKRRMASVAIYSVSGMMPASAIAVWSFLLVSAGHESQRNLLQGVVASVIFAACCSVLVWSIIKLRRLPS